MNGLAIDVAAWSSPWRHRSPGDKLVLALGLVLSALVLPPWPAALIVTMVACGLALGPGGVAWRTLGRAARAPLVFIGWGSVGIAVAWQSSADGLGPLTVTPQTLASAAQTAAHAVAGSAALLLLATTTPLSQLLEWARRRGLPDVVADVAGLVYRLLFVLQATTSDIRSAQTARLGYASRAATMRSATGLTAAVLIRSWSRARRLEEGLAGRGMDGALRVLDETLPSSPRFVLMAVGIVAGIVTLSLICAEVGGGW